HHRKGGQREQRLEKIPDRRIAPAELESCERATARPQQKSRRKGRRSRLQCAWIDESRGLPIQYGKHAFHFLQVGRHKLPKRGGIPPNKRETTLLKRLTELVFLNHLLHRRHDDVEDLFG